MHPEILSISNTLFYQNQIQDGYVYRETNKFLDKKHPVLIIDVKGEEYRHGTSIQNQAEAEIVSQMLQYLTSLTEGKKYNKEDFWVITPYYAQQILLKAKLETFEDQIITIDAS